MRQSILKKYAQLIAQTGANVQPGQEVLIQAEIDNPKFVQYVAEACYKLGASKVSIDWNYQPITKLHIANQTDETLSRIEDWEMEKLRHRVKTLPALIYLMSDDPDAFEGVDQTKYSKAMQKRRAAFKPLRDEMDNKYQWCIAAIPNDKWAKKMFPGETKAKAVSKLWEAILYTSRADSDPIAAWDKHNSDLAARCDYLNSLNLRQLEYKASNGTDLKVGLMEQAQFLGGGEYTLGGVFFNPNIPTEEVFISPKRGEAEGIVYSSRPLAFQGQLIENFSIRFENGKAVEIKADKNEELLKSLVSMDEGAAYLGECALVPYDSPIRNTELLFYNTLFDENAACHLALGEGFTNCIKGYENYSLDQCREMGINNSIVHEDFMIGTDDLNIVGVTADGKRIQIFKDGNWAF